MQGMQDSLQGYMREKQTDNQPNLSTLTSRLRAIPIAFTMKMLPTLLVIYATKSATMVDVTVSVNVMRSASACP